MDTGGRAERCVDQDGDVVHGRPRKHVHRVDPVDQPLELRGLSPGPRPELLFTRGRAVKGCLGPIDVMSRHIEVSQCLDEIRCSARRGAALWVFTPRK